MSVKSICLRLATYLILFFIVITIHFAPIEATNRILAENPRVKDQVIAVGSCTQDQNKLIFLMIQNQFDPQKIYDMSDRITVNALHSYSLRQNKLSQDKTIWKESTFRPIGLAPSAKIQFEIGAARDCREVFLLKSVAAYNHLSIKLFSINPNLESAVPIADFDSEGSVKRAPEGAEEKPLAIYEKKLIVEELCDDSATFDFDMMVEPQELLISLHRNERCDPFYLRLNLESKEWTEVQITGKDKH